MLDRRDFMKTCSSMGLAGTLFPGVLWRASEIAEKVVRQSHSQLTGYSRSGELALRRSAKKPAPRVSSSRRDTDCSTCNKENA